MTEYQLLHLIIHETGFKCLHMCMHVGVCVGRVKETKKRFIKEQRKQKKTGFAGTQWEANRTFDLDVNGVKDIVVGEGKIIQN